MGTVDRKPRSASPHLPFVLLIFDSGASLSRDDSVGPMQPLPSEDRLGGMAAGMLIEGIGNVQLMFQIDNQFLVVNSRWCYVPDSKARLIGPQHLLRKEALLEPSSFFFNGRPIKESSVNSIPSLNSNMDANRIYDSLIPETDVEKRISVLQGSARPPMTIEYDFRSHLPTGLAKNHSKLHPCVCPKCEICEYAKAHHQPTKGNKQSTKLGTDGSIKDTSLRAGQDQSADHFKSHLHSHTLTSIGKTACLWITWVDMSMQHQLGVSRSETIWAKQSFEKLALDNGVIIHSNSLILCW